VKRLVSVELFEEHPAVNYYVIRFWDEDESLFDQFLTRFDTDEFETDLQSITYWLDVIGNRGALERYFKPEGHPRVKAIPVPPPNSVLRLYCFRISDQVLILGGGKDKRVRKFQDDPELQMHVTIVKTVGKKLLRFIELRKASVDGKMLKGKLTFEIGI
jgi:hypothetical protein